jgi:ring-1,2-phenylacetyl-CoA epoxidase subunit PaaC
VSAKARSDSGTGAALFEYLLRLGDDRLVLGHRLAQWCGHAPILEEDIALANIALDCIGQANYILDLAADTEGSGRSADDLAYLREEIEFRNVAMVELPNGDFGFTIARQFLFSAFAVDLLEALQQSSHAELAGIAGKALKESRYHLRHSREWVLRLGDGTEESHRRIQASFDDLWMYTGELFETDAVDEELLAEQIISDVAALEPKWRQRVAATLEEATLTVPDNRYMISGGRQGRHTEHLGHMLAQMQILPRSHPGATW